MTDTTTDPQTSPTIPAAFTRRTVVRAAGVLGAGVAGAGALAACGGSSTTSSGSGAAATSSSSSSSSTSSSSSSTSATSSGSSSSSSAAVSGESVKAASVPVGGGVIQGDDADTAFVVTQPTAGTYKAFSAKCTHQACKVGSVADGTINCPCHGSRYDISTGAPTKGPATKPLTAKTATLNGDSVVVS